MCHAPILLKLFVMHYLNASRVGILIAVSTVTLDNCSVNDSKIGLMESRLGEGNMLLGGKHLHTRCCAHILNLIVHNGLEVIKKSIARIREGIALLDCYTKDV